MSNSTNVTLPTSFSPPTYSPRDQPATEVDEFDGPETILPIIVVIAAIIISLVVACIVFRRRQIRRKRRYAHQLEITNRRIRAIGLLKARAETELANWPHSAQHVYASAPTLGQADERLTVSSISADPPIYQGRMERRHSSNCISVTANPTTVCTLGSLAKGNQKRERRCSSSDLFIPGNPRSFSLRMPRGRVADVKTSKPNVPLTDSETYSASHAATQGSNTTHMRGESSYMQTTSIMESPTWARMDPRRVRDIVREQWTGTPLTSEVSTDVTANMTSSHVTSQSEKWV